MSKVSRGIVAIGSLVALTFGLSPAKAAPEIELNHLQLCSPTLHDFSTTSDNEYFPMLPGQQAVFFGEDDGESVGLRITVLRKTETFYSDTANPVVTGVVEELEWADDNANGKVDKGEERIEISQNYFAQTEEGTVCYFGEDVKIYEDGKFKGDTEGSWRADELSPSGTPNAPGIIMPDPVLEDQVYLQEDAPDVAQDRARHVELTNTGELHTEECNLAEPNGCDGSNFSTKTYKPGLGLVQDGDLEQTKFSPGKSK